VHSIYLEINGSQDRASTHTKTPARDAYVTRSSTAYSIGTADAFLHYAKCSRAESDSETIGTEGLSVKKCASRSHSKQTFIKVKNKKGIQCSDCENKTAEFNSESGFTKAVNRSQAE